MYDDQGHIPVKLLAGRDSSALTIGAGVAFAILGHGGAPHIAGRNLADPEPLVHTVRLIAGGSLIGVTTSCATKAVASSDISFPCNEGETILDAAERAGYALPYSGSVAKIVKLEHAWRRLDGRNDDGFQVAPFPG